MATPCGAGTGRRRGSFRTSAPRYREAVEGAGRAIFVVVADPPAVESVLGQIEAKLGPGQFVIQSSTISAPVDPEVRRAGPQDQARSSWRPRSRAVPWPPSGARRSSTSAGRPETVEKGRTYLARLAAEDPAHRPAGIGLDAETGDERQHRRHRASRCARAFARPRRRHSRTRGLLQGPLGINALEVGPLGLEEAATRGPATTRASVLGQAHGQGPAAGAGDGGGGTRSLRADGAAQEQYDDGIAAGWAEEDLIGLLRLVEKGAPVECGRLSEPASSLSWPAS